ncbi:MAG: TlpA disulfide reductase family protein [Candidatus Saganbacteria bacterium]|nr:TlpA disulfide reductase family protein [Candidatus Saganbacteria bacterium]
MKKTAISILVVLLIFFCISGPSKAENSVLNIGSPAPEIVLPLVNGGSFTSIQLKGKAYILTFFSTWSDSCLENLRFLQGLKEKNDGLEVVAVSLDNKASSVASFLRKNGLSFISLIDKKKKYLDEFEILVIPTTYFIDRDGILKNQYVSFDDIVMASMTADVSLLLAPKKSEE